MPELMRADNNIIHLFTGFKQRSHKRLFYASLQRPHQVKGILFCYPAEDKLIISHFSFPMFPVRSWSEERNDLYCRSYIHHLIIHIFFHFFIQFIY